MATASNELVWGDSVRVKRLRHEYNCRGQHRLVVDGAAGLPASYDQPAWIEVNGRRYMACTEFCGEAVYKIDGRHHLVVALVKPGFVGSIRTPDQAARDCTKRCVCFQS